MQAPKTASQSLTSHVPPDVLRRRSGTCCSRLFPSITFIQVSSDSLFDNGRGYIGLVGAFRALEEQMQISEKHPEHCTDSARGMKKIYTLGGKHNHFSTRPQPSSSFPFSSCPR